jgi:beta-lactamase regulating signal transducer with metallopeptidase domain
VLLALWSTGAAATGLIACCRWRRIQRLMQHARPASAEWQALATDLAHRLSLRRAPELIVVPGRLPPLVAPGLGGPRVLFPAGWIDRLTAAQREALLLHELTHIARRDHLVRLLELMVSVTYWWLLPLRWIGRSLRACEEACCDASVVAHMPGARREYAGLLLDVLDFASPVWAGPHSQQPCTHATAMSAATDLEHRLRAILHRPTTARRTWPAATLAAAISFAILPCQLRHEVPRLLAAPTSANHVRTADPTGLGEVAEGCEPVRLAALCCPS